MKTKFPGFYHPDTAFFDALFRDAIIVLDTNILLDLYRVSPKTSKELIEIIKKLGARIWIPYQVALEYHRDLFNVVEGQINKYKDATAAIESIRKTFLEKRSHPFLPDDLHSSATKIFDELLNFFETQKNELEGIIMENSVKDELCQLLNSKIGDSFKTEELSSIYKEGEERFSIHMPPGFMDNKKPGNEKYGDLVVWKEILRKSKEAAKPVLFVTDDTKEDWFMEFRGKTYGPHPHLMKEFKDVTGHDIYIYTLERFLANSEKLKIQVTETTLDELKARKEAEVTESVSGQISLYEECQSESSTGATFAPTIDEQLMSNLAKRVVNRRGQVRVTKPAETDDDVDSGYIEDEDTNNR